MNRLLTRVFLSLSLLAVFACAGENPHAVAPEDVIGHKYFLESVDGGEIVNARRPFIAFGEGMAVNGAVCNSFRGKGALADGVLTAGPLMSTRMLCLDGDLSQLETRFFRLLEQGLTLTFEDGKLVMEGGGARLIFVAEAAEPVHPGDLLGKKFLLEKVDGEEFTVSNGRAPFMEFDSELRATGVMCNNFIAPSRIENGKLVADNVVSTMMLCLDEKLNRLEGTFHKMLREGAEIELSGSTLTLKGAGTILVFEAE